MDIWHFIERDHANIAHLIHEMPAAFPGTGVLRSRDRLLADLIDELDRHAAALAGSLYPALRRDPDTANLIADLAEEEAIFMGALRRLQRQRADARGWLDRFADASYVVDRWLHRHRNELAPAAQARLFGPDLDRTADAFIRARRRRLDEQGARFPAHLRTAGAAVALTSATALLIWRLVVADRHRDAQRSRARSRATATAAMPRGHGEDPHDRQERLLDEALEETFPASDPIAPTRITR